MLTIGMELLVVGLQLHSFFFFFFFNVTTQRLLSREVHFDFLLGIRFWVSLFICFFFFLTPHA